GGRLAALVPPGHNARSFSQGGSLTRLDYRTPNRKPSGNEVTFSEFTVPLVLLVGGLLIYGIGAFMAAGAQSAGFVMGIVFVLAAIQTILGILAAYATAALIKTSFGELRTAVLKLAGIIVFCGAIAYILPSGG